MLSQALRAEPSENGSPMPINKPSSSAGTFLRDIYKHYKRDDRKNALVDQTPPWHDASDIFTAATLETIRAHQSVLTEVGVVDGDPFCGCQDWIDITVVSVRELQTTPVRADAVVVFHDIDGRRKEIAYRLVLTPQGWRVDDMSLLGTSPDGWLVETLKAETAALRQRALADQN